MSKPEIDWDRVFAGLDDDDTLAVRGMIIKIQDEAYAAGQRDTVMEGPARAAMLEAQAWWLDTMAKSDGDVGRVVARTIAMAFGEAAERLRPGPRPTLDPAVGLCGSSEPHDQHRFDEDYVDGKLTSWRTCQGISPS